MNTDKQPIDPANEDEPSTGLREQIYEAFKASGEAGITVREVAEALGVNYKNVYIACVTSLKSRLRKTGPAQYRVAIESSSPSELRAFAPSCEPPSKRVEAEQFALPNTETADLAPAILETPAQIDLEMAEQLTKQHEDFHNGEQDQKMRGLFLGAMGLKLRAYIVVSSQGHNSATRGPTAKGQGLKGWLERYAPTVTRSNLYDWMAIAEGVQNHFRLDATVDLKTLMCSGEAELAPHLVKTADRIRKYLDGKSRTQLQLAFANRTTGGKRDRDPDAPATEKDTPEKAATDLWIPLIKALNAELFEHKSWADLPAATRRELRGIFIDGAKLLPE